MASKLPQRLLLGLAAFLNLIVFAVLLYVLNQPGIIAASDVQDESNAQTSVLRNCLRHPQIELCRKPETVALVSEASRAAFAGISFVHRVVMAVVTILLAAAGMVIAVILDISQSRKPIG